MLEKMSEMIAEQLNCDAETITADTSFKDDLGADSLDLFELVMALEDEYNIEIPAEELTELNTVGDVIDYLRDKGRFVFLCIAKRVTVNGVNVTISLRLGFRGIFSIDILNGLGI